MYPCCYRVYLLFRLYYVGKVFHCLQRGFYGLHMHLKAEEALVRFQIFDIAFAAR